MDDGVALRRMRLALDMFDAAEGFLRMRLRRETPNMSDEELDAAVRAWRLARPGAEHGDAQGRPSTRFT